MYYISFGFGGDNMREAKQVIVMRKDLGMRKGKMVAQGAHASLGALLNAYKSGSKEYRIFIPKGDPAQVWLDGPFVKICVGVNSLDELLNKLHIVETINERRGKDYIPYALITDAGRTEFKEPTITCLGIGPYWSDELDKITGDLKLL